MTATPAVVACATMYAELEQVAPQASVRTVPQALHEFPGNPPDDDAIARAVQAAVDALDGGDHDHIALAYSRTNDGLARVRAGETPLVVSTFDDCIDLIRLGRTAKAGGTYYLTRGWIDRGVDAYKLYRAFDGSLDGLVDAFAAAAAEHDGLVVDWHESDRFERLARRGPTPPAETLSAFFEDLVGGFEAVVLVDTGTLTPFHRSYAESFAGFLERVGEGTVGVQTEAGTHRWLEALLEGTGEVQVVPPGQPVEPR